VSGGFPAGMARWKGGPQADCLPDLAAMKIQ
jgi:hypothetical protein